MRDEGEFGRLLHQLRRERDLTQENLGQAAFCSRDTIKKLESGQPSEPAPEGAAAATEASAEAAPPAEKPRVTEENIAEVVAMCTGIPVVRINQ